MNRPLGDSAAQPGPCWKPPFLNSEGALFDSQVNRAVCYNGAVVGYSDVNQGTCKCFEGAYGLACEFLRCPNNCSAAIPSADFAPADDLKRGMCDRYTGVCQCGDGFSGLDCSGVFPIYLMN